MTRKEIIYNLFTGKNFNDCISKMEPGHLRDDLRQEVILVICEMPEEKILQLHQNKALEFYTVKVILNMMKNRKNKFSKKYRNTHEELSGMEVAEIIDTEERQLREQVEDMALEEVDRLYWYNKGLIELYIRHGNFRAVEKATGIPFGSVYKTVKKSLIQIKCTVTK